MRPTIHLCTLDDPREHIPCGYVVHVGTLGNSAMIEHLRNVHGVVLREEIEEDLDWPAMADFVVERLREEPRMFQPLADCLITRVKVVPSNVAERREYHHWIWDLAWAWSGHPDYQGEWLWPTYDE